MYKKYRLVINEKDAKEIFELSEKHEPIVKCDSNCDIDSVLDTDNANWIMDTWFPNYDADIFLSHSHNL